AMNPQQVSYSQQDQSAFNIAPVIARLAALRKPGTTDPLFRQVRGAADLAAVTEIRGFIAPEAFVVLMIERGKPAAGRTRQPVVAAFSVVLVGRNYAHQQHGQPAADDVAVLKAAAREALIGWTPNT